jgi:heme exporter protein D
MNAHALQVFFAMSGYAAYVWPAYAVFFIVLIADTLAPRLRRRRVLRELRARLARQSTRQDRARQDRANGKPIPIPPSP